MVRILLKLKLENSGFTISELALHCKVDRVEFIELIGGDDDRVTVGQRQNSRM